MLDVKINLLFYYDLISIHKREFENLKEVIQLIEGLQSNLFIAYTNLTYLIHILDLNFSNRFFFFPDTISNSLFNYIN